MSVALTFVGLEKEAVGKLTATFNKTKGASSVGKVISEDKGKITKVEWTTASHTFRRTKNKDLCWHGQLHLLAVAFEQHPNISILQKGAFTRANYLDRMEALKAKWIKKGFWGCTCIIPGEPKAVEDKIEPKKKAKQVLASTPMHVGELVATGTGTKIVSPKGKKTPKVKKASAPKTITPLDVPRERVMGETQNAYGELVDLESMIAGFYVLESIAAPLMQYGTLDRLYRQSQDGTLFYAMKPALRNFAVDFLPVKRVFDTRLARMLFDYLALACFGEARHGSSAFSKNKAIHSDPRQFLPVCEALFRNGQWSHSYGGPKWARIAAAAQYYFMLPPSVFVDHVVDLSHNCNIVFDKGCIVTVKNVKGYKALLDRKREGSALSDDKPVAVPDEIAALFYRALMLHLLPAGSGLVSASGPVRFYDRIQWGEQTVSAVITGKKKGGKAHGTVATEIQGSKPFEPQRVA